jgi:hypothetical protein
MVCFAEGSGQSGGAFVGTVNVVLNDLAERELIRKMCWRRLGRCIV